MMLVVMPFICLDVGHLPFACATSQDWDLFANKAIPTKKAFPAEALLPLVQYDERKVSEDDFLTERNCIIIEFVRTISSETYSAQELS